jgi:hypothetical protein
VGLPPGRSSGAKGSTSRWGAGGCTRLVHSSQAYLQGQSNSGRWAQGVVGVQAGGSTEARADGKSLARAACDPQAAAVPAASGQQHSDCGSGGGRGGGSGAHLVSGRVLMWIMYTVSGMRRNLIAFPKNQQPASRDCQFCSGLTAGRGGVEGGPKCHRSGQRRLIENSGASRRASGVLSHRHRS